MIQVYKRKINVVNGEKPGDYYCAGYSRKGTANTIAISEEMKDGSSSFTKGEIVGVTLDLPARIKQAMLDGKAVMIDGLGTFKPSIGVTKVQENAEDLKTSAIRIKGINFKPDAALLSSLNAKAEYEWISIEKADAEDETDNEDSGTNDTPATGGNDDTPSGGDTNPPSSDLNDD